MRDYEFWNRDEVVEAIKTVEQAEMSGATSVTYGGAGGFTARSLTEMSIIKRRLYRRMERFDKKSYGTGTNPRRVEMIVHSGYGHSPFGRGPFGR